MVRRGRPIQRAADRQPRPARIPEERPQIAARRNRYVLYPGTQSMPAAAAPKILNRPFSINAEVELREGAEGVLLSMGGNDGGIALYVKDGQLCYVHNYVAKSSSTSGRRGRSRPGGTS